MLKISHRGNLSGRDLQWENSPAYLMHAIASGFDVEVDVWVVNGTISFGHDAPTWKDISEDFLLSIGSKAWFHCKNLEALHFFNKNFPQLAYFWHQTDDYTLTSNGFIWTYPGKQTTDRSILVSLGKDFPKGNFYAICSDYVVDLGGFEPPSDK